MGNQQERSLAWMAGIIDGEGSISVQVYTLPDGRVRLTPFVSIVNSDLAILAECRRILDSLGIKNRDCKKPKSSGKFTGRLECSNIRIDGQEPVAQLCNWMWTFLVGEKKHKALTVLRFILGRKEHGFQRNELGQVRRSEYTREEIELISSIRSHPRAKSSEAICSAPNVIG